MIKILIVTLTIVLVVNCVILIGLVLIQLPKKEAGLGTAFGGGATDALFGPGAGNLLTTLTKYTAGIFLGLSLLLSTLSAHRVGDRNKDLMKGLSTPGSASAKQTSGATASPAPLILPEDSPLNLPATGSNNTATITGMLSNTLNVVSNTASSTASNILNTASNAVQVTTNAAGGLLKTIEAEAKEKSGLKVEGLAPAPVEAKDQPAPEKK